MKWCLLTCLFISGCAGHSHTKVNVGSASPHGGLHAHIEGGRGLATFLGLSILAAGIVESEGNPNYAPEMAPDRKVSEQDCTKPIDYTLGNIRCK